MKLQDFFSRRREASDPSVEGLPGHLQAVFEKASPRLGWRDWSALGVPGLLILAVMLWGVFGTVPTRVGGRCIVMQPEGTSDVSAEITGRIVELLVQPGSQVAAGQSIARVASPELAERIHALQSRVADLERNGRLAEEQRRHSTESNAASYAQRLELLQSQRASAMRRIAIAEQQLSTTEAMRKDGLVTARSVASAQLDLEEARQGLVDVERRIAETNKGRSDYLHNAERDVGAMQLQAHDARRELDALLSQSDALTQVRSPISGRVIEIKAGAGSLVKRETPIVALERTAAEPANAVGKPKLEVLMFVSAADGKRIETGNSAEILPDLASREEYGLLRGRVSQVSDYPLSPQALQARIANQDLVRELARTPAPFQVRITLDQAAAPAPDAKNPYEWSARKGAQLALSSGTLCQGEILVLLERPIGLVIPIFSRTLR